MKTKTFLKFMDSRALALLLALAAVFSALLLPQAEAATVNSNSQVLLDGEYGLLLHDDTSKCVNIGFATKTEDQKGVVIIDNWNMQTNETLIIKNRGGGYVTLSPKHAPDLCLNILLGDKTPGNALCLHHYTEGDACSMWLPIINSDGSVSFKNQYTGLYIDVRMGSYTIGNVIQSYTSNGDLHSQGFYLKLASAPSGSVVLSDGAYALLLHDDQSKCLNIRFGAKTQDKAGVVCVDYWSKETWEIFIITNRGSGRVTISPSHAPELCLNALLANPKPRDGIALHTYTNGDLASLWLPIKNADGSISFRNCATGYMLDILNADYSIGNTAISWHSNGNQRSQSYFPTAVSPTAKTLTNGLYGINTSSSLITCGFDGYQNTAGRHEGIDFKRGLNMPVYALTDGVITRVTYGSTGSGGLSTIAIYNSATNKTVVYLHTAPLSGLYAGKTVRCGEQIAVESWRGVSSASSAHTHVEVRNGRCTAAAKSVGDYTLDNPNPTSFWTSLGYRVY